MLIREAIQKIDARQNLTREEARRVMASLLSGSVADADIVAFLAALRDKGEQSEELVGFAEVMRACAAEGLRRAGVDPAEIAHAEPLLDTCGTGGDGHGTFNVSTAAALVCAAAGVRVAKHGNRSISSRCGSADVLEALGVTIDIHLKHIPACLEKVGMVFLFAPLMLLIALGMTLVIATRGKLEGVATLSFNVGDLLALGSMAMWASYTVFLRLRRDALNTLEFLAVVCAFGMLWMTPWVMWELAHGTQVLLSAPGALAVAYSAIGSLLLAYAGWSYVVTRLGAARAGVTMHLMPALGVLMAMLFLGEVPRWFHVAGIALILSGVALSSSRARREHSGRLTGN